MRKSHKKKAKVPLLMSREKSDVPVQVFMCCMFVTAKFCMHFWRLKYNRACALCVSQQQH